MTKESELIDYASLLKELESTGAEEDKASLAQQLVEVLYPEPTEKEHLAPYLYTIGKFLKNHELLESLPQPIKNNLALRMSKLTLQPETEPLAISALTDHSFLQAIGQTALNYLSAKASYLSPNAFNSIKGMEEFKDSIAVFYHNAILDSDWQFIPPKEMEELVQNNQAKIREMLSSAVLSSTQVKEFEAYLAQHKIDNPFQPIISKDLKGFSPAINKMLQNMYLVAEPPLKPEIQQYVALSIAKGLKSLGESSPAMKTIIEMAALVNRRTICYTQATKYITPPCHIPYAEAVFLGTVEISTETIKTGFLDKKLEGFFSLHGYNPPDYNKQAEPSYFYHSFIHEHMHAIIDNIFKNESKPFTKEQEATLGQLLTDLDLKDTRLFRGLIKPISEGGKYDKETKAIEIPTFLAGFMALEIAQATHPQQFKNQYPKAYEELLNKEWSKEAFEKSPQVKKFFDLLLEVVKRQHEIGVTVSKELEERTTSTKAPQGALSIAEVSDIIKQYALVGINPEDISKVAGPSSTPNVPPKGKKTGR